MAAGTEAGLGQARAGGRVLLLLSDALNASILRSLARGPLSVSELSSRLCPTSRTTRFSRLRDLEDLGVIARQKQGGTPPITYCMLTPAGQRLLPVLRSFARWLRAGPNGPSSPNEVAGACAIKALAIAWDATALRWFAERPCSLTKLDAESPPEVSYHELRKAREALSAAGLIAPVPSEERGQTYAPTEWARRSAGCLAAAIRWERAFLNGVAVAPSALELEALLLLALPLLLRKDLHPTASVCSLEVDHLACLSVAVEEGSVVACTPGLQQVRGSRVAGPPAAWLDALVDGQTEALRMQGKIRFAAALETRLHGACS
jgi:DNA-binding HxlR family transcriptional regulator